MKKENEHIYWFTGTSETLAPNEGSIPGMRPLLIQLGGIYIPGGMALFDKDLNIWKRLGLAGISDLFRNIKLDEHFKSIGYPFFLGGDYSHIYRLLKLFKQN